MDAVHAAVADPRDLLGLLLACRPAELQAIRALVEPHRRQAFEDPRCNAPIREWPDYLASVISAWVAEGTGAGSALDLARVAVTRLGGRVADDVPLERLDAALLAVPDASDEPLVALARHIARLRRRKTWPYRLLKRLLPETRKAPPAAQPTPPAPPEPVVLPAPSLADPVEAAPADTGVTARIGGWLKRQIGVEPGVDWSRQIGDWLKSAVDAIPLAPWQGAVAAERAKLGQVRLLLLGGTAAERGHLAEAAFGDRYAGSGAVDLMLQPNPASESDLLRVLSGPAGAWQGDHAPHLAWVLLEEGSTLPARLAAAGVPWIGVVMAADQGDPRLAQWLTRLPGQVILPVRAEPRVVEGITFAPQGLDALIDATDRVLPDAVRAAFDAVQRVDLARRTTRALAAVRTLAMTAGGSGALPIPLADVAGVFAVQVRMVIAASLAMGVTLEQSSLRPLAVAMIGALASTAAGRFVASQVLKLAPGLGSIVGGAVSGTVAAATTYALGHAYVEYLRRFHAAEGRMPGTAEIAQGFQRFWADWGHKEEPPPG
jgi:uncharacterized protein (DUF697 family)